MFLWGTGGQSDWKFGLNFGATANASVAAEAVDDPTSPQA